MLWNGEKIKNRLKEKHATIIALSEQLGISRQTINSWINGQVPKGHHLIGLCRILGTEPGFFFTEESTEAISVPLHRTIRKAKVTEKMQDEARELVKQYEILFKDAPAPGIVPVLRVEKRDKQNAVSMAKALRKSAELANGKPIDYKHTFLLLDRMGIVTIFRQFPEPLKSYAFYSEIYGHRVVFVNTITNVLDLIFPLLHEAIHAIRDEKHQEDDQAEEKFCDMVANYVQFPDEYLQYILRAIEGCNPGTVINKLKAFAKENGHSLFGIVERLKEAGKWEDINVGGANTTLKRHFRTIGDILFQNSEPRAFIDILGSLSPKFIQLVREQLANSSIRKLGEWLNLNNTMDSKAAKEELQKLTTSQA